MDELKEVHLIVLHHGLWGGAGDLAFLTDLLQQHADEHKLAIHLLNIDCNENTRTYDGIDVCGDRVVQAIRDVQERLQTTEKRKVTKISFIGYSLGGLILRFAIGRLQREGAFTSSSPGLQPVNFITIASPHLGAWRLSPSNSSWIGRAYNKAYHGMVPVISSMTGYQLMLKDEHLQGRPLLMNMTDHRLAFYQGLERFQQLILLANIRRDNMVPYRSASVSKEDPYEQQPCMAAADPVKYPSVVKPCSDADAAKTPADLSPPGWLPLLFLVLIPILIPVLLVVLAVLSFLGKKHYCKTSALQKQPSEAWLVQAAANRRSVDSGADVEHGAVTKGKDSSSEDVLMQPQALKGDIDVTRATTLEKQNWMVDNLNRLPFQRVDVDPQHRRAHAAIVVRIPKQCKACDHLEYMLQQMKW